MNILGIDPGINGALSLVDSNKKLIEVVDMPTLITKVIKGKAKKTINYKALELLISAWVAEHGELIACVENVHAMPGQGTVSMFSMGETFGAIKAILTCLNVTIIYVAPQTWKKYHNIPMGPHLTLSQKKELSRSLALRLYPTNAECMSRKKDSDRAEAILIARYGVDKNK